MIALIEGERVFSRLKYESGVHRVQRVPATEQQGRVHTSAITVAVLPEAEEVDVKIEAKDLRIDTFCSSGPGGQSVNPRHSWCCSRTLGRIPNVICQDEIAHNKDSRKWHAREAFHLYEAGETQKQAFALAKARHQTFPPPTQNPTHPHTQRTATPTPNHIRREVTKPTGPPHPTPHTPTNTPHTPKTTPNNPPQPTQHPISPPPQQPHPNTNPQKTPHPPRPFVDTSVWYAAVDGSDPSHANAKAVLSAGEPLFTSDHVLIETWALLRSRIHRRAAELFWDGLRSGGATIEMVGTADLETAWQTGSPIAIKISRSLIAPTSP